MSAMMEGISCERSGEAVHFPLSLGKSIALIASGFGFLACGALLYSLGHHFVGWLTLYFLAPLIFHLRRLFSGGAAALTVSKEGLTDQTPNLGVGFIPWDQIQEIELRTVRNQSFLEVRTCNQSELLARLGWMKRGMAYTNGLFGVGSILINLSAVEGEPWFIMEMIKELRPSPRASNV